jgi:glycine oxidase
MARDVIIVGGGVIGCAIAWRLAQAGVTVTLLERGRIGCEASRAAAGMLSPQGESQTAGPFFDLCLKSRAMYRTFAEEVREASGKDIEYRDEGTLFVVLRGDEEEEKTRWVNWQLEAGLPLELLSADEVCKLEPAVADSVVRGIFLPEEHQVENRRLMDALEIAIKRGGVEVIEGADVTAISTDRDRVIGVESSVGKIASGAVVVAAGTWSSHLLEPLGLHVDVTPARGQMVALKGDLSINRVLHSSEVYVVPRRDGRILIGATVEYAGFRKAVTPDGIRRLLNAAVSLAPGLRQMEIHEMWSGLRPDTIDHLPIIGATGTDNLFVATGHFRNGILLAPITASAIERVFSSGVLDLAQPFGIGRFDSSGTQTAKG